MSGSTCPHPCACDVDAWHDGPATFTAVGDWITIGPTDDPVERIEDGRYLVEGEWWEAVDLVVEVPERARR